MAKFKFNILTGLFDLVEDADSLGLDVTDSPTFTTVKCSNLTDGYIPYHVNDATGFANSILFNSATGITLGIGAANIDYSLTFDGEHSNGVFAWMEDEDYFQFSDGILIPAGEQIYFRDTDVSIESTDDAYLNLIADGGVEVNAPVFNGIKLIFGEAEIGSVTNYTDISTTGDISQVGTARHNWTKIPASSVTITVGDDDAESTVENLQTANDGNIFWSGEVAATPGYNILIEFTSVVAFNWLRIRASYVGSATHALAIQLYDFTGDHYHTKNIIPTGLYSATAGEELIGDYEFTIVDDTKYIGTAPNAGKVWVRILHPMTGNASHDLYIDEVALYQ